MKKLFAPIVIVLCLVFSVQSCASFFGSEEPLVVTTADQILDPENAEVVPTDQVPASLRDVLPEGTVVVLTERSNLKPDATYVALGPDSTEGNTAGWMQLALGIGSIFIPGLAAWEGVLTMFSERKRKHYVAAAKKATPAGEGPMDWKGMLGSIKAALGSSHSSKESEKAFVAKEVLNAT
jgi:hypothetical protein